MSDYRKVLKFRFYAYCNACNHEFDLDKNYLIGHDKRGGVVPLKSTTSAGYVRCLECGSMDLQLHYAYRNEYRRRCPKCEEMFETFESWKTKCDTCMKEHAELMSKMGA